MKLLDIRELNYYQRKNVILIKKAKFGDKKFVSKKIKFNIFCFHHALTKNYNDNTKFNLKKSLKENTNNIKEVFKQINCKSLVIISNTIFQNIPAKKYKAVNNYGVSKSNSFNQIKNFCKKMTLNLSQFI